MPDFVPISGLPPNATITIDDFVAIVDSGSLTTQRASIGTVNSFFAASGSNLSSSHASMSISNSYAIFTDTASYVFPTTYEMTASWTENLDSGSVAGTASLAYNARTASRLEGIGSSYENNLVISRSLTTNNPSYVQLPRQPELTSSQVLPNIKHNTVFLHKDYSAGGYGKMFLNDSGTYKAKLVLDLGGQYVNISGIGPDIDTIAKGSKGILFQTDQAGSGGTQTSSVVYIRENGRTYLRYVEALEYSSSKATTDVGFYGTASYVPAASFSLSSPTQWPLGGIVGYAGPGAPVGPAWANWTGSNGQPFVSSSYPDLAGQISNSFCVGATASFAFHRSTFPTTNTVTVTMISGSGIFSMSFDGGSPIFLNAVAGYSHTFTGNTATHSYAITDYGYRDPRPAIVVSTAVHVNPAPGNSSSVHYFGNRSEFRLPQLKAYFETYADPQPISWLILQATV